VEGLAHQEIVMEAINMPYERTAWINESAVEIQLDHHHDCQACHIYEDTVEVFHQVGTHLVLLTEPCAVWSCGLHGVYYVRRN